MHRKRGSQNCGLGYSKGFSSKSHREGGNGQQTWSEFDAPTGFELKSGETLENGYLAYKTHGTLNADKSNVILHPTSFDACSWELEFNIGPGKTLDTDKYFVIVVNLLGNGVSFSPSNCKAGQHFPKGGTTMCDNVRLQSLLLDSLGIDKLALIYGYSMGCMQALHWSVMFPERVLRVAGVCGSAKASDYNVVFLDSLKFAMYTDPDCQRDDQGRLFLAGKAHLGLKAFARIYAGWGIPMEFYRQELWRESERDGKPFESREDFVARSYDGGFIGSHPLNLLAQLHTWKHGDVSKAYGLPKTTTLQEALGRITAKVTLMPCSTDSYFTVAEIEEEARMISGCVFAPIESNHGHRAGDPHRVGQDADAQYIAGWVAKTLAM